MQISVSELPLPLAASVTSHKRRAVNEKQIPDYVLTLEKVGEGIVKSTSPPI